MLQVLNGKVENMEWNGRVVAGMAEWWLEWAETISDSVHWCMMTLIQDGDPVWRANSFMYEYHPRL